MKKLFPNLILEDLIDWPAPVGHSAVVGFPDTPPEPGDALTVERIDSNRSDISNFDMACTYTVSRSVPIPQKLGKFNVIFYKEPQ